MTDTATGVAAEISALVQTYSAPARLGHLLCDAYAGRGREALLYEDAGRQETLSFDELQYRSRNLAAALADRGIGRGDRVAVLLPRSPQLVTALIAIWRLGAVHVPLFTAFGPDAVNYRCEHSGATAVITDTGNRSKLDPSDGRTVAVFCVGSGEPGDLDFLQATERPGQIDEPVMTAEDSFILLYTSGTTGKPKGVQVPVRALASFHAYMTYAVDLREDDVFWNVSDPGWAYGLWYGVVGPLLLGHTTTLRGGPFDPADALQAVERLGITNLAGSPTFYRAVREHGVDPGFRERTGLRAASSAGEPLSPDLLDWSAEHLGTPIHDHYGQSEVGMAIGWARHPQLAESPGPA